jgi:hypothetical protein
MGMGTLTVFDLELGDCEFETFCKHRRRCIFNVQYTPRGSHVRLGGRVHEQWPHRHDSALRNKTVNRGYLSRKTVNFVVAHYAPGVSPGKNTQRTIICC